MKKIIISFFCLSIWALFLWFVNTCIDPYLLENNTFLILSFIVVLITTMTLNGFLSVSIGSFSFKASSDPKDFHYFFGGNTKDVKIDAQGYDAKEINEKLQEFIKQK